MDRVEEIRVRIKVVDEAQEVWFPGQEKPQMHQDIEFLLGELDRLAGSIEETHLREVICRQFAKAQEICQRDKLGLGGGNIIDVLIAEYERLKVLVSLPRLLFLPSGVDMELRDLDVWAKYYQHVGFWLGKEKEPLPAPAWHWTRKKEGWHGL